RLKISHVRHHSKGKSKKAKGKRGSEPRTSLPTRNSRAAQGVSSLSPFAFLLLPSFDAGVTCAVPYSRIFPPEGGPTAAPSEDVAALWNSDPLDTCTVKAVR